MDVAGHYLPHFVDQADLVEVAEAELEVLGEVEEREVEGFGEEARRRAPMEHAEGHQAAHLIVPVLAHSCRDDNRLKDPHRCNEPVPTGAEPIPTEAHHGLVLSQKNNLTK